MQPDFKDVRRVFAPIAEEVARYAGEKELVTGLTTMPAPGHTPGHSAFVLASGEDRLLLWADTTNKPELFVTHPGLARRLRYGPGPRPRPPAAACSTWRPASGCGLTGYHFPFPANGYIAREGEDYAYVPGFWHGSDGLVGTAVLADEAPAGSAGARRRGRRPGR